MMIGGILQRYVAVAFLRNLLTTWLVLTAVLLGVLASDKWDDMLEYNATTQQAVTYFVCILPQAALLIFPAVCLIGALFGTLSLVRHHELTAMLAAGRGLAWLAAPTVVLAFLIGAASFYWNEFVAAPLSREGERIMNSELKGKKGVFQDYGLVRGTQNRFIRYDNFDNGDKVLRGFVLYDMKPNGGGIERLVRADIARWDPDIPNPETGQDGAWWLDSGSEISENFVIDVVDQWNWNVRGLNPLEILYLEETPQEFGVLERQSFEMSYAELRKRIRSLEKVGGSVLILYPDLYFKVAFPFSIAALILIGLAAGSSSFLEGREGAARFTYPLALCIVILGLYYCVTFICLGMGWFGILTPFVSAWLPNLVFGSVGVWMLARA